MPSPRLRAAAILLGLGLVVTPALSGCIPSVDDLVGGLVQEGIQSGLKEATGLDIETGKLPAGFPSDVPLAEGDVVGGLAVDNPDGKGWVVQVSTDRSADDVRAQLQAAGFAEFEGGQIGIAGFVAMENAEYLVTAIVGDETGKRTVSYTVIVKSE